MEYLFALGLVVVFVLWLAHVQHLDEEAYWAYEDNLLDVDEEDNDMI